MELSAWYHVRFDAEKIYRNAEPAGSTAWADELEWKDIIRICFQAGDLWTSDELYIFTNQREESYLIPLEAEGGLELWNEIIQRGLFDATLAVKVATSGEGLFCWPPADPDSNQ